MELKDNEIAKPINFDCNYLITNQGRLFSLHKNRFLSEYINDDGYIKGKINGKRYFIHRLVAQHFIDNPENKPEVNHKDFIKSNNNVSNLEWCTRKENIFHAKEKMDMVRVYGESVGTSKLTDELVKEIIPLTKHLTLKELASMYNVSTFCILCIKHNKTWKHISRKS